MQNWRLSFPTTCVAIVMGVVLLAGSNGCKRKPASDGGSIQRAAASAKLAFWHIQSYSPTKEVVASAVSRFRARNPGVTVEEVPLSNDPFKQKLKIAMGAGSPPDVFHTWGGGALKSYVDAGRILDLTPALNADPVWRDSLYPRALDFCSFDGKVCAIPTDVTAVGLFYNKAIFERLKLDPPQTFEQLMGCCEKLKAQGVIPFAMGNSDKWPGAFFFAYLATRVGGTGPFRMAASREKDGSFADPCFIRAGEMLQRMVKADAFPPGFNGMNFDQARRLFFTERAGMILMGSWLLAYAGKEAPEMADKIGCVPFPVVENGRGSATTVIGGVNAGYAISSSCANPVAAIALLKELSGEEAARQWAATGRIPALKGDIALAMISPQSAEIAKIVHAADEIQLYYDQALPPRLAEKHKETTQNIFALTTTPDQAAKEMENLALEMAAQK
ncbi:MAG TPA: extracellular solute-binding protein [Candidatus Brocadiia bacterium]|nr:extracellular solute-binding protein [Candidatus Brocadiia bacterium]